MVVWRVVRLRAGEGLNHLPAYADAADAVLIEPRVAGAEGGAGVALDLALAQAARERLRDHRMVLAGGLTPETVAGALALVGADVADVSSGVETHPGIKDPERVHRFVEAVVGQHAIG
jgi:phosphoribosylanthranilate isomerase